MPFGFNHILSIFYGTTTLPSVGRDMAWHPTFQSLIVATLLYNMPIPTRNMITISIFHIAYTYDYLYLLELADIPSYWPDPTVHHRLTLISSRTLAVAFSFGAILAFVPFVIPIQASHAIPNLNLFVSDF